jgi:hypothetical protein
MLNTFIKNQGVTKTIIHDNNRNYVNMTNWDADYDGNVANISINTNTDGANNYAEFSLTNDDLANILNVQSVNTPIHMRLKNDFEEPYYRKDPYFLELPTPEVDSVPPRPVQEIVDRHISSPLPGEELILPLNLNKKTDLFTLTSHKRHRKPKTHITHKVYKKHKTSNRSNSSHRSKSSHRHKSSHRSNKNRHTSRKYHSIVDLL